MFNLDTLKNYNKQSQGINIYVKPSTGNDGNSGLTPAAAVKTLVKALSLATANQNDTVYMFAESNTAASTTDYQSTTLDWNKDMVHLIGVNAGQRMSHRSRIALISTYDTASNLMTVSADGCRFENLEILEGVAGTNPTGCLRVTGTRNNFVNCHIAGIGNAANDIAGAYSLMLTGNATENNFENCVIGLDTVARGSAANAEIYLVGTGGGSKPARNVFKGCYIIGMAENATNYSFVDATYLDRFVIFDNCIFTNPTTNVGGATVVTYAIRNTTANGVIIMHLTSVVGCTDLADNEGMIYCNLGLPTAADAGLSVVATKS
jgi:hypothetical protein